MKYDPSVVSGKRSAVNHNFRRNPQIEKLADFADWATYELPPGPAFIPMRYYVNLHKGGMMFYILFLMWYF